MLARQFLYTAVKFRSKGREGVEGGDQDKVKMSKTMLLMDTYDCFVS